MICSLHRSQSSISFDKPEIDQAIATVFAESQFIGGSHVKEFEDNIKLLYNVRNCIALGNGTDALFASLKMLGIGPGDEVITPALSWISTAETITLAGAKPVFADVHSVSLTIHPDQIIKRITKRTKGVVIVHLYGQAAQVQEIKQMCTDHDIYLIEDCAHAYLTGEFGKMVGTFGDTGCFSFYPTKNLGAYGDGGSVITNNDLLAEKIHRFANHGGLHKDEHVMEGMNSRMDTLQAALLSVKLRHLQEWTEKRIEHAAQYHHFLNGVKEVVVPEIRPNTKHSFHFYVIRAKNRDALKEFLKKNGIDTVIHYPAPLPFEPAYAYLNHEVGDFPEAEKACAEILSLPIYPELTTDQIVYVCEKVRQFYNQ